MKVNVYLMTRRAHSATKLHAWDVAGDARDFSGALIRQGLWRFEMDMSAPDLRNVFLKFWFPGESPEWEKDDYVRRIPAAAASDV